MRTIIVYKGFQVNYYNYLNYKKCTFPSIIVGLLQHKIIIAYAPCKFDDIIS